MKKKLTILGLVGLALGVGTTVPSTASAQIYARGDMVSVGGFCLWRQVRAEGDTHQVNLYGHLQSRAAGCNSLRNSNGRITIVLTKWNGSGYTGCVLETYRGTSTNSSGVTLNKTWYTPPCGAGYYAGYMCAGDSASNSGMHLWSSITGAEAWYTDCQNQNGQPIWTPDWFLFAD